MISVPRRPMTECVISAARLTVGRTSGRATLTVTIRAIFASRPTTRGTSYEAIRAPDGIAHVAAREGARDRRRLLRTLRLCLRRGRPCCDRHSNGIRLLRRKVRCGRHPAREAAVMFTKREKAIIKRHYPHLRIRFMARGVMAQKQAGGAWGLLYSNKDARAHIDT